MWPFRTKVTVYRQKTIDWNKVKTVKDLVSILKEYSLTKNLAVAEHLWDDPRFKNFLGDSITKLTYHDGVLYKKEEE